MLSATRGVQVLSSIDLHEVRLMGCASYARGSFSRTTRPLMSNKALSRSAAGEGVLSFRRMFPPNYNNDSFLSSSPNRAPHWSDQVSG